MSIKELEAKAKELKELQRMADELTAEMDAIKDEIRIALGDKEEVIAGAFKITNKPVTSNRMDTTAIKKELPEIAQRYNKQSTVKRLVIV